MLGQANLSLVLFSTDCAIPETATPISEAPELNDETYIPEGATALLDAINALRHTLAATPDEERVALKNIQLLCSCPLALCASGNMCLNTSPCFRFHSLP